MTVTRADLLLLVHEHFALSKAEAAALVADFFEQISSALERGDQVKLAGFGTFCVRDKVSRPGRNPKTGQMIAVSARRVVTFYASKSLRKHVITDPQDARDRHVAMA